MKKVLFLITTLNGGGAEKILVDTVNSLDNNKYDLTVQTVIDEGIYINRLNKDIKYKTIIKTKNKFLRKLFSRVIIDFIPPRLIYNVFIKDNYDYEIAFLEGVSTKFIATSTNKTSKKIAWVHTDLIKYPNSYKQYGTENKEATAYKKLDTIVCVSEDVKKSFIKKYNCCSEKVKTIYNILDDKNIIKKSREIIDFPIDIRPCFITVGRLIYQKGYDILLRIHKRLIDEGFEHSLLILGEGDMRKNLEEFIIQNKLDKTVKLLGFDENPYKYIKRCDLFISSSRVEGYSTVISEALVLGVPIISTNTGGAYEPMENPRCNLVVGNNEQELYIALKEVLLKPQLLQEYKKQQKEKIQYFKKYNLLRKLENKIFSGD
ncbi:MAG: glycosyltransferase [Clostridia bacterium]|nr:glycosyltransferase [Clostridia bacterium]